MSFTTALYEGDSVIHRLPRFGNPAPNTRVAGARSATALETAELATAEIKGWTSLIGSVSNAFRTAIRWLDEQARNAHYKRIESYLAQSVDHADLERRIRNLDYANRLNWTDCGSR